MIIKKIILHNLASIEDAVIDFTVRPLKDEPLFLINGPTGAGKSTILDAVCLALFGEMPRLYKVGEKSVSFSSPYIVKVKGQEVKKEDSLQLSDIRQIMRRGTGECFAAVVFATADGTDYEARWGVSRAYGKTDSHLQAATSSLTNLKTGTTVGKNVTKEVERLIHLNFEQFCRTSMLAQGEFTKFLQGNSSEKAQILEKLTGTEDYSSISKKIAEITSRKRNEVEKAKIQYESIALLTDDQQEEIKGELNSLKTSLKNLSLQREKCQGKIKWLSSMNGVESGLRNVRQQLESAEAREKEEGFVKENQQVALFRRTEEPRQWLSERKKRTEAVQKAEGKNDQFAARYDMLQAHLAFVLQSQADDKDSLKQWEAQQERWSPLRDMLEREQTLVQQLRQAKSLLNHITANEQAERKKQEDIPVKEKEIETAQTNLDNSKNSVEETRRIFEQVKAELEAMKPDELTEKRNVLDKKRHQLKFVQEDLTLYDAKVALLEEKKRSVEEVRREIAQITQTLPELEREERNAGESHDRASKRYEVMKESLQTHFKVVRRQLHQGGVCPLCGQTVESQPVSDSEFEVIVKPLEQEYVATRQALTNAKSALLAARENLQKQQRKLLKEEANLGETQKSHLQFLQSAARHFCQALGRGLSPEQFADEIVSVRSQVQETDRVYVADSARLNSEWEQVQAKNSELNRMYARLEEVKNLQVKAENHLSNARQALLELKKDISRIQEDTLKQRTEVESVIHQVDVAMIDRQWRHVWESDNDAFVKKIQDDAQSMRIADEKVQALRQQIVLRENSLSLTEQAKVAVLSLMPQWDGRPAVPVNGRVSANNVAAEWADLLNATREWRTEIETLRRQVDGYETALRQFHTDNPDVSEEALLAISLFTAGEIERIDRQHAQVRQLIASLKGQIGQLESQKEQLSASRPELQPEDTVETLQSEFQDCDALMSKQQQEMGRLKNRLDEDVKKRQDRKEAIMQYEQLSKEFDKWNKFNEEFGSADGSRFRKIAQSFLLSHLLIKANNYLRHFSDRYELVAEPGSLAILVRDRYTQLPPQYVKILSGGETFMVSLSLALSLAQLNDTPSAVDTIFIDEGFGTLDAESLNAVMDTLEKLHQIGGRRVGVISHVEDLRQRISVQVNVEKVNPTLSKVTVRA